MDQLRAAAAAWEAESGELGRQDAAKDEAIAHLERQLLQARKELQVPCILAFSTFCQNQMHSHTRGRTELREEILGKQHAR